MDGIIAYILSKKYTNDTVIGMGAIKGAACQVQSINKVNKTTTITLEWEDNVGTSHTQSFDIEDGLDGVSVTGATIKPDGHLELTLSNGNSIDCGQVLPQYDTMPTPSASNEGQILQYIGTTTSSYTNGYFYQCINDGGVYKWVEKSVQDSYTKIQIGDLSNLPDNTKNVVENIIDINSKLDNKENIFRYNVIPAADVSISGAIIQYLGATNATYTNGYYYQCVESPVGSGTYVWIQKNVQPNNGGGGGDGVVDGYYKSADQLFYEDSAFLNPIAGEDNTIYVDLNTNGLYRYNGTIFIKVSSSAESIQVTTLPSADVTQLDKIYQYIGTTDTNYTKGYFYRCILDGSVYKWVNIATQDSYTKAEIGDITDLPDNTKNVVENISDLDNNKENIFRYAHSVDIPTASVTNVGTIIQYIGTTTADYVSGFFYQSQLDTDTSTYKWVNIEVQPASGTSAVESVNNKTGVVILDAEDIGLQVSTMPTADIDHLNQIVQYIGATSVTYINGYWYKCVYDSVSGTYSWEQTNVQPHITVDSALSDTSENPVQNKVITVPLQALQGSMANKANKVSGATVNNFAGLDANGDLIDSGINKDIVPSGASSSNQLATKEDIKTYTGENGVNIDSNNKVTLDISYLTASRVGYIPSTEKGSNNGVAELDSTGKVPSAQLPSYVDDVIEGYKDGADFYTDSAHTQLITPESGKIYVDLHTDTTWRWGGSAYVQISESLALGETSTTAYYGDKGKTAYDHSQIKNGSNPHETTADNVNLKVPIPALSGSKLDVESTLYGINTELGKKADKVASATNGHLAGLDSNGNLTDSGVVADDVYVATDTAETTIDDADYFPFYDSSASGKKKSTWDNIKAKLKAYFDTLYSTFSATDALLKDTVGWVGKNKAEKTVVTGNLPQYNMQLYIDGELEADKEYKLSFVSDGAYKLYPNEALFTSNASFTTVVGQNEVSVTTKSAISKSTSGQYENNLGWRVLKNGATLTTAPTLTNIMLRDASIVDDTFEPYHESVDIIKANRDEVKDVIGWSGKNELQIPSSVTTQEINGITFTVTRNADGEVTEIDADGTASAKTDFILYPTSAYEFTEDMILSGCTNGSASTYKIGAWDNTASVAYSDFRDGVTIPKTINGHNVNFAITVYSGATVNHIKFYPMLRDASIADATYEPYHASVEQCKFDRAEQRVLGAKNFFNTNIIDGGANLATITDGGKTIRVNNTTAGTYQMLKLKVPVVKNTDYILTSVIAYTSGNGRIQISDESNVAIVTSNDYTANANVKLSFNSGNNSFVFIKMASTTEPSAVGDVTYSNTMLRIASDPDDTYVPYAMTNAELTRVASSVPTIAPTPASDLTESDIVDAVNSATATNANAPSLYGVQKYSNEKKVRRVLNGANIPSGTSMTATGIGTWTDKAIDQITSADETDWWYDAAFVVPVYYMLTSDTSIVTGKTYYTRSGTAPNYTYTVVASPVVADIGTYYEQYSDDVDISIKFDPSGDTATLGGYIFDSTTGKICIKFGNSITVATARIAVDITYTRNEVG